MIKYVSDVVRCGGKLRWFRLVERKVDNDWLKTCRVWYSKLEKKRVEDTKHG